MKGMAAAVCGFGVAVGVIVFLAVREPPAAAAASEEMLHLRQQVAENAQRLELLEQQVAKLGAPRPAAPPAERVQAAATSDESLEEQVRQAVEEWMATHTPEAVAPVPAATEPEEAGGRTAEQAFRQLTGQAPRPGGSQQQLWEELRKAGMLDAVVALFEQRATRVGSADAYVELGDAYLQKVFEAGGGPEAGRWATKADQSFDQALDLDDHHWEARFSKAVNLSFWPPMFGKQPEAIRNLEILVEQQGSQPRSPEHAQTFLILGNLYNQAGDQEKATTTWQQGRDQFPEDKPLQEKP